MKADIDYCKEALSNCNTRFYTMQRYNDNLKEQIEIQEVILRTKDSMLDDKDRVLDEFEMNLKKETRKKNAFKIGMFVSIGLVPAAFIYGLTL